ncbi:MAG TPA: hypothetical protein VIZ66_04340 [Sphingomicrobium sp.]
MSKLKLIGAGGMAVLLLGACSYNDDYNNQAYNASNADYNAEGANYAGNEADYNAPADYNGVNAANTSENMTNAVDNTAGNANAVTNNGY